jgi:hypothetical protein
MEAAAQDVSRHLHAYEAALAKERASQKHDLERKDSELSRRPQVYVKYFESTNMNAGFLIKKCEVRYMMQLMVGDLPIGQAWEIRKDTVKQVDRDQVKIVLDDYAKPFMDAGVKVAVELTQASSAAKRLLSR